MRWWLGASVLLAVSLALRLEYAVYALYAFLGVLGVSWHAAWRWTGWLAAARRCSRVAGEIGDRATVTVALRNAGRGRRTGTSGGGDTGGVWRRVGAEASRVA